MEPLRAGLSEHLLILLLGPSGSGKTTILKNLQGELGNDIERLVSTTTRPPRFANGIPQEIDGVDYHFVSDAVFNQKINSGDIFEHTNRAQGRYGMCHRAISEQLTRAHVIKEIDGRGLWSVKKLAPVVGWSYMSVFIAPRDIATVEERLNLRGTESPQVRAARLAEWDEDMAYQSICDHSFISGTQEEDLHALIEIVMGELTARGMTLPSYATA